MDDLRMATGLWHDVRFGARLLLKEKTVTLVVVATLSLAIAANVIVFGLAGSLSGEFARAPLLFWMAVSYVALLPLEVRLAIASA